MFLFHDFYPLWAAGRVLLEGGNPYDDQNIIRTLISAGVDLQSYPGGFHNPPWSIWLFIPCALMPLLWAEYLWVALQALLVTVAVMTSLRILDDWQCAEQFRCRKMLLLIGLLSFFPLTKLFLMGQSSAIILFAVMLGYRELTKKNDFLAGALFSLALLKFQLIIPIFLVLLAYCLRTKRVSVIKGLAVALSVQCLATVIARPAAFNEYYYYIFSLFSDRSTASQTTLGHLAASITGKPELVALVSITSCITFLFIGTNIRGRFDYWFFLSLLAGLICAPYAWSHDFVIALLPYFFLLNSCARKNYNLTAAFLTAATIASWIYVSTDFRTREQLMIIWPVLLAIGWIALRKAVPEKIPMIPNYL